jgi:hypothetical protein
MTKHFPKFHSHEEASCFNCGGDFGDEGHDSGHAAGHGEFVQHCEKCSMSTWYDLKRPKFVLESTGANRFSLHLTH